jgi:type II secretory pathway pseudopilin PulG
MEEEPGFTLADLLITVGLIALLAAIILPNLLRSRVAAGEAAAISSIREISKAEVAYQAAFPSVGFAGSLEALGPENPEGPCTTRSPQHACLLDGKLSNADSPLRSRNGYWFLVTPGNRDSHGVFTEYVVGASATFYGKSGVRDFCSTEDGVLRFRLPRQQSIPVTTLPECRGQTVLQ